MLTTVRTIADDQRGDLFAIVEETIRRSRVKGCVEEDLSPAAYARLILVEGRRYLDSVRVLVLKTADFFRCGDELQANVHLIEMVWGVEWFLKVIEAVGRVFDLDYEKIVHEGKELSLVIADLNQTVVDMQAAHENSDTNLLPDLLEFELAPQLQEWKDIFVQIEGIVEGKE